MLQPATSIWVSASDHFLRCFFCWTTRVSGSRSAAILRTLPLRWGMTAEVSATWEARLVSSRKCQGETRRGVAGRASETRLCFWGDGEGDGEAAAAMARTRRERERKRESRDDLRGINIEHWPGYEEQAIRAIGHVAASWLCIFDFEVVACNEDGGHASPLSRSLYCCRLRRSLRRRRHRHRRGHPCLHRAQPLHPRPHPRRQLPDLSPRQHPRLHPRDLRPLLHLVQRPPYQLEAAAKKIRQGTSSTSPPTSAPSSPGAPPRPAAVASPLRSSGTTSSGRSPPV